MRWAVLVMAGVVCAVSVVGCSRRKSSLLLERQARGRMAEEPLVAQPIHWTLEPVSDTQTQGMIEVFVNHASAEYLTQLFRNKAVFGAYAGANPYYPEHMVFYIKVANMSERKIYMNPGEFTLIDDQGNQFSPVGVDYVTAFAEYRRPVSTTTRGMVEGASPGYFGISFPVGKLFASKPQGRFALLKRGSLQSGFLHPGVTHDGLVAFWNPGKHTKALRLLVTNIKTNFNATDEPQTALEFAFGFSASR